MEKRESNEALTESRHSVADELAKMIQRFQQRLIVSNTRFIDRYLEGGLQILVHFVIRPADKEFVALFHGKEGVGRLDPKTQALDLSLRKGGVVEASEYWAEINAPELRGNRDQQAVFVDTVKFVQAGEVCTTPSVVWFETADRFYSVLPQALYLCSKGGLKLCGANVRGELNPVWHWDAGIIEYKKLNDEMIHSASEVMDTVASNSRQIRWSGINPRDVIVQLSSLRITLDGELIGLSVIEGPNLGIEFTEMRFGPFDFCPDASKSLVDGGNGHHFSQSVS
jgi:hypothetical protein